MRRLWAIITVGVLVGGILALNGAANLVRAQQMLWAWWFVASAPSPSPDLTALVGPFPSESSCRSANLKFSSAWQPIGCRYAGMGRGSPSDRFWALITFVGRPALAGGTMNVGTFPSRSECQDWVAGFVQRNRENNPTAAFHTDCRSDWTVRFQGN